MKNAFLFILTFVITISCSTNHLVKLNDEPNLNKIFTRKEISNLEIIVKFFDSILVANKKEQDVNVEYHEYFENINTSESMEDLRTRVGLANVKSLIDMLKNQEIFNEIWKFSNEYDYKSNDTISLRLNINLQGKYFILLESLGKDDDFMKQYCSSMQASGNINPALIASVIKHYKDVNFQRDINRLIWAVHYITILFKEPYIK